MNGIEVIIYKLLLYSPVISFDIGIDLLAVGVYEKVRDTVFFKFIVELPPGSRLPYRTAIL